MSPIGPFLPSVIFYGIAPFLRKVLVKTPYKKWSAWNLIQLFPHTLVLLGTKWLNNNEKHLITCMSQNSLTLLAWGGHYAPPPKILNNFSKNDSFCVIFLLKFLTFIWPTDSKGFILISFDFFSINEHYWGCIDEKWWKIDPKKWKML